MMSDEQKRWLDEMKDPAFAALTQEQMAERLGFARASINRWCQSFPWREVANGQLLTIGRKIGPILDVLYKKGLRGNLGAIQMILELVNLLENKLKVEVKSDRYDDMSDTELMAEILRGFITDPNRPGFHLERIQFAMRRLSPEEQAALRQAVLDPIEAAPDLPLDHGVVAGNGISDGISR